MVFLYLKIIHSFFTRENACKDYYYIQQKYYTDCGFWHWQACTTYKYVLMIILCITDIARKKDVCVQHSLG